MIKKNQPPKWRLEYWLFFGICYDKYKPSLQRKRGRPLFGGSLLFEGLFFLKQFLLQKSSILRLHFAFPVICLVQFVSLLSWCILLSRLDADRLFALFVCRNPLSSFLSSLCQSLLSPFCPWSFRLILHPGFLWPCFLVENRPDVLFFKNFCHDDLSS